MSTTHRRLETLSLLQSHPGISATQLAARLGVTPSCPDLDLVTVVLSNCDGPAVSPIVNAARTVITAQPPNF